MSILYDTYIAGLVQNCSKSSALAVELLQYCSDTSDIIISFKSAKFVI